MAKDSHYIDANIASFLSEEKIKYELFNFSLQRKLSYANSIKRIINNSIEFKKP